MSRPTENRAAEAGRVPDLRFRRPEATDGVRIWDLVAACPPLDRNSIYCNILQCTHFAETCVLVEQDGEPVGWIAGYLLPAKPRTLFVWQVAVHEKARGLGLARRMLFALLERPALERVEFIRTTVTPENEASRALFRSFAARADAAFDEGPGFDAQAHFDRRHDSERLITIGPIPRAARRCAVDRSVA
jgi:L-2,4-diaminobutyric acid acetyltransferase